MLVIALVMGTTIHAALPSGPPAIAALPKGAIDLPGPGEDADGDSYPDQTDRFAGNAMVRIEINTLRVDADLPYLVVGTQDDHWRTGADAELAWPHIVDPDPLGHRIGSGAWKDHALRTGTWQYSTPQDGAEKSLASQGTLAPDTELDGVTWPQIFWLDVRDDREAWAITIEAYDAQPKPDDLLRTWVVRVLGDGTWTLDGGEPTLQGAFANGNGIRLTSEIRMDIPPEDAQILAEQWAPTYHFDADEAFFPLPGDALQQYHGIAERNPDYRTWTREFNNGRDAYVLWLADFNGDRTTNHEDAAIIIDLLRAGGLGEPTVYARTHMANQDQVVIQYWTMYAYNFVWDEGGDDVALLAHNGDREFIQLTFNNLTAAQEGTPTQVCYSQHYHGICIDDATDIDVWVARGSHASYPAPGDDRRVRPAFAGFGDIFEGGITWEPGNYTIELFGGQEWHAGYLWGPVTRHSRDLGTAGKPLLQHTFRYPFQDPLAWQHTLEVMSLDEAAEVYGGPE